MQKYDYVVFSVWKDIRVFRETPNPQGYEPIF